MTANSRPTRPKPRLSVNPIAYWAKAGRTREVLDAAFTDLAQIGFTAVKADVPEAMTPAQYLRWLDDHELRPAISLFNSPFDTTVDITAEIERAKRFAEVQTALGLDRSMVSSVAVPARMARPAVGADFHRDRLESAIENCGIICGVLRSGGLWPIHHSHVGGVFETEDEITELLDDLGPALIGFGPDTGHLRWAGIEPASLIERYADRIGGMHVKDVFADHLRSDPSRSGSPTASYRDLVATKRLWCEPGRGIVDFDAVLAALPADYDGDFMIEIDEPSVDSCLESHRMAYEWARWRLPV